MEIPVSLVTSPYFNRVTAMKQVHYQTNKGNLTHISILRDFITFEDLHFLQFIIENHVRGVATYFQCLLLHY